MSAIVQGPWFPDTPGTLRKVVTTAGTRVQLSTTSISNKGALIQAETDNTGNIAVGDVNVVAAAGTQRGTILGPGDTMGLLIADLSSLYLDSTVNGDGVTITYFN